MGFSSCVALVTQQTRLEGLVERWSTKNAARFRFDKFRAHEKALREEDNVEVTEAVALADLEADFDIYESENESYQKIVRRLRKELDFGIPVVVVDRQHLPTFLFERAEAVVVVGQDGLVANTAKYARDLPIIGVNPDPQRIDGLLLPYQAGQVRTTVKKVLDGRFRSREVTLAEARTNDGQQMLAFNDFFVGHAGHSSARYTLRCGQQAEPQSSSGVLIATGAGSTGWMSSVFNMTQAIAQQCGTSITRPHTPNWEDAMLTWAVREPFVSKHSGADLVFGQLNGAEQLVIESLMPENGVVFSDGISTDFLEFNSGTILRVGIANSKAQLVVPLVPSGR